MCAQPTCAKRLTPVFVNNLDAARGHFVAIRPRRPPVSPDGLHALGRGLRPIHHRIKIRVPRARGVPVALCRAACLQQHLFLLFCCYRALLGRCYDVVAKLLARFPLVESVLGRRAQGRVGQESYQAEPQEPRRHRQGRHPDAAKKREKKKAAFEVNRTASRDRSLILFFNKQTNVDCRKSTHSRSQRCCLALVQPVSCVSRVTIFILP